MKKCRSTIYLILLFSSFSTAQVQTLEEKETTTAFMEGMEAFVNEEYDVATTLLLEAYEQLAPQAGISFALADVYFIQEDLPNAAFYGKEAVH